MKYISLFIFLLLSSNTSADGIHFEKELSFQQALEKAKQEDKILYIDFYTTWCGPCKIMAKNYFPTDEAGEVYNADFVSLKIDAEKGEGVQLAKKYEVRGYPTSLFLDPRDGSVMYSGVGCPQDLPSFLQFAHDALAEYRDTMSMDEYVAVFEKGQYDEDFITALLAKATRRKVDNTPYLDAYFAMVQDKIKPDSALKLLVEYTPSTETRLYQYVDKNFKKLSQPDMAKAVLNRIAYNDMMTAMQTQNTVLYEAAKPYFKKYNPQYYEMGKYQIESQWYAEDPQKLKTTLINYGEYMMDKNLAQLTKEDEDALEMSKKQIRAQLEQYGIPEEQMDSLVQENIKRQPLTLHLSSIQTAQGLNEIAWKVYENYSDDKPLTTTALKWAKRASRLARQYNPESWPAYGDTVAHLFATIGGIPEAIKVQTEVVEKAKELEDPLTEEFEKYLQELQK